VAIATALMPPLCTAGYGVAIGNFDYFLGAMYLFTINTIFIALATFLVMKLLKFPMLRYANSAKRKLIARIASFVAILVMIPALLTFITVYKESKFKSQAKNFVENEVKSNEALQLMDWEGRFETETLFLNFYNEVSDATKKDLLNEFTKNPLYPSLRTGILKIKGSDTKSYDLLTNAYQDARDEAKESRNVIEELNKKIEVLESHIVTLESELKDANRTTSVSFTSVAKDAKIRFPDLLELGYGQVLESNFMKVDTVKIIFPKWKFKVTDSVGVARDKSLREWITKELNADTLLVR